MLKFESIFWAASSENPSGLTDKLKTLGFTPSPSSRDPGGRSLYFGPEAIEIIGQGQKPLTLSDQSGGHGILGIGLESDDIAADYKRIQSFTDQKLGTPKIAKDTLHDLPMWTGFNLPSQITPLLKAWVVMNSPAVLEKQAADTLPHLHPNTCFGIEAIHVVGDPKSSAQWGSILQKHVSGLQWNEQIKGAGKRIQVGERFLDIIESQNQSEPPGVFMITLQVTDIEQAHAIAKNAGANPTICSSRDGFLVPGSFTGGPTLRFVRAFWKRYLPEINKNYPLRRRTDKFRPLGGAYSSTLQDGFEDNWKY